MKTTPKYKKSASDEQMEIYWINRIIRSSQENVRDKGITRNLIILITLSV